MDDRDALEVAIATGQVWSDQFGKPEYEGIARAIQESDWLAEHDRQVAEKTIRGAAQHLRNEMDEPWGDRAANRLDVYAHDLRRAQEPNVVEPMCDHYATCAAQCPGDCFDKPSHSERSRS